MRQCGICSARQVSSALQSQSQNSLICWSAGVLEIRETGNSTAIPGLTIHKPSGPEGILSLLNFGKFAQF